MSEGVWDWDFTRTGLKLHVLEAIGPPEINAGGADLQWWRDLVAEQLAAQLQARQICSWWSETCWIDAHLDRSEEQPSVPAWLERREAPAMAELLQRGAAARWRDVAELVMVARISAGAVGARRRCSHREEERERKKRKERKKEEEEEEEERRRRRRWQCRWCCVGGQEAQD
ncbi:hypothetical protein JCGZ_09066 [Jatropha curcas]|uniref:Uncharacterized protein n=2 Tax=Jatropha curcas TaxID=180498 RepID=A0A067KKV1_JATCU|nr:hypothetical protein JCGZ_09066 [Jatropha curcas]